jgi:hypothetical protein
MNRAAIVYVALLVAMGCQSSDEKIPPITRTVSLQMASLAERVNTLNQHVGFQRHYESLDFDINYLNHSGQPPVPSEWDVRLVAIVPEAELQAWVPPGVARSSSADTAFLKTVPTTVDYSNIREWYVDQHAVVGLDRAKRIVVYYSPSSKFPQ